MGQAWLELFFLLFLFFSLVVYRAYIGAELGLAVERWKRSNDPVDVPGSVVQRRPESIGDIESTTAQTSLFYITQTQSCYGLCAAHFSALFFALCGCARVARSSSFIRFALDEEKKLYEEIWKNWFFGAASLGEVRFLFCMFLLYFAYTIHNASQSHLSSFHALVVCITSKTWEMKNLFLGTIKLY